MEDPECVNPAQERIYGYLRDFIGNLTRKFLRFTTGSAVLSSLPLKVIFNSITELARRPMAHTCNSTIELSVDYTSFNDFFEEIMAVISDQEYSWCMDIY